MAAADESEATRSARLDVLGALARRDLPHFDRHEDEYRALASAIGGDDVNGDQVLADVKAAARDSSTWATSESARRLPHHLTAFFMEDICSAERVLVDDEAAIWVFSEFETDAAFDTVAEWVNPENWPVRSPQMFKGMQPVDGPPVALPAQGGVDHWHGDFLETVQLVERLETVLHCDFYRQGDAFAGMTYSLVSSKDDQLDVDRGFLLVNDLGASRHVKALKIVGFVNDVWNDVAMMVCPVWTDFVRGAVRGGSNSGGLPPSSRPGSVSDAVGNWIGQMRRSTQTYTAMALDWCGDVVKGGYRPNDLVRDGARFWLQVYRDMAMASANAYAVLQQLAGESMPTAGPETPVAGASPLADLMQPAAVAAGGYRSSASVPLGSQRIQPAPTDASEGTTIPVLGFDPKDPVRPTQLTRIGAAGAVIPASAVSAAPEPLTADVFGIHVEADTAAAPHGLYIGELLIGQHERKPVQLYVSRAVRAEPA